MKKLFQAGPISNIFLVMIFASCLFLSRQERFEPDAYYHYKISKITSESGLIRELSQFPDLGWNKYFPEKEFLFHAMTSIGYKIMGEAGVNMTCNLLFIGIMLLIIFISDIFISRKISVPFLLVTLMNFNFTFRLFLIRPHLAAIFFFLLLLLGLLKGKKLPMTLGTLGFALSYHAFYMPLALISLFLLFDFKNKYKDYMLFAFLPLFIGLIINPYFPSNLHLSWLHFKIALGKSVALNVGGEIQRLSLKQCLEIVGIYFPIMFISLFKFKQFKKEQKYFLQLFSVTTTFLILFLITPRAIEYFIPMATIFLLSMMCSTFWTSNKQKVLFIFFFIVNSFHTWGYFHAPLIQKEDTENKLKILSLIPENEQGKIFNCEWSDGAYIFYKRPHMKAIDLLDPNFLFLQSDELGKLRKNIVDHPNALGIQAIKEVFKANYILCSDVKMVSFLNSDSGFERLSSQDVTRFSTSLYLVKNSK
jgi:hypothetical protein